MFLTWMLLVLAGAYQLLATWSAFSQRDLCDGVKFSFYSFPYTGGIGFVLAMSGACFLNEFCPTDMIPATPLSIAMFFGAITACISLSETVLRISVQLLAPQVHFWQLFGDPAEDSVS